MYSHDGKSEWERKMLETMAGESRGRTRDYTSEQAGEADLIQGWDFALTYRVGAGVHQRGIILY